MVGGNKTRLTRLKLKQDKSKGDILFQKQLPLPLKTANRRTLPVSPPNHERDAASLIISLKRKFSVTFTIDCLFRQILQSIKQNSTKGIFELRNNPLARVFCWIRQNPRALARG